MRALRLVLLLLLAADPVLAQNRAPSPCDHYIPTGEKLPRQDYSRTQMLLQGSPNPTWRDRPVAKAWPDEPVTILQECGLKLRISTLRGEEGWVPTSMLTNELQLYERARRRAPATEAECAQRFIDPRLVQGCRDEQAAKQRFETEARTSAYLPAGELTAWLSGKTVVLRPRVPHPVDDVANPTTIYFAPDGEVFLRAGPPGGRTRWRGRWVLEGDSVCLPGGYVACARFRKLADGRTVWVPNGVALAGYLIERSDGDSAGSVAVVSESYPNPKLPPVPSEAEGFSMPSLGR